MNKTVLINYTNWKGETADRRIQPQVFFWGSTSYHPEEQWLLQALDLDKQQTRIFAMKDVHSWTPQKG